MQVKDVISGDHQLAVWEIAEKNGIFVPCNMAKMIANMDCRNVALSP
jgi:hypothetical protein